MEDCVICKQVPKYKCPVCRQPYCSVACCKIHKQSPCTPPVNPQPEINIQSNTEYEYPTEDTVTSTKLDLLGKSVEVKECLENPHVRKILMLLDGSPYPDEMLQEYMQEPIFTEFVDACLKVVQPPHDYNK